MELYEFLFKRMATRIYSMEEIPAGTLAQIRAYIPRLAPLHDGIETHIELLTAGDRGGAAAVKAPYYLHFYSQQHEARHYNAGFMLQQMDLYLSSLGLGSCWLGMGRARKKQLKGMDFIIMMAFGKAAQSPHRDNVSQFRRKQPGEISIGQDERLEAARLAPSTRNMQPWFLLCQDSNIHIYRSRLGKLKAALYDGFNKIDIGIMLCHLYVASQHFKKPFQFVTMANVPRQPEGYVYIGTVPGG